MNLDDALNESRLVHRRIEAPAFLEARLRAAAVKRSNTHRIRWISLAGAAAAALLIFAMLWRPVHSPALYDDFIPVPGSESLPAPMATSVLRVELPASTLQQYGIEAAAQPEFVKADLLVGDDGLARAVRFNRENSQ